MAPTEPDPIWWMLNLTYDLLNLVEATDYKDLGKMDRLHHWLPCELLKPLISSGASAYVAVRAFEEEEEKLNEIDRILNYFKEVG